MELNNKYAVQASIPTLWMDFFFQLWSLGEFVWLTVKYYDIKASQFWSCEHMPSSSP